MKKLVTSGITCALIFTRIAANSIIDEFFQAIAENNPTKVSQFIGKFDINTQDPVRGTGLMAAAFWNHENIVQLLLQVPGINVNLQDYVGYTALILAALRGHENIVRLLLQVPGININAQDADGWTALIWAAANGYKNIVKLLLTVPGININAQDKDGKTAFILAIERKYPAIAKVIQSSIKSLIQQAFASIKQNNLDIVRSIVAQIGVDSIFDSQGNTLLDKAVVLNRTHIIEFLLQNAKDARELLAKFPFEGINPTSDLFKYFYGLAFNQSLSPRLITPRACRSPRTCWSPMKAHLCQICSSIAEKYCSRCKKIYYCSGECQKKHWLSHKTICQIYA